MKSARQILDEILASERYNSSKLFDDRVYRDEPILRTGADAFDRGADAGASAGGRPRKSRMPTKYRTMRAMARTSGGKTARSGYAGYYSNTYAMPSYKTFYEQASFMEGFEDDFDEACTSGERVRCYEDMSNHQLRCYFTWRTRFMEAFEEACAVPREHANKSLPLHIYAAAIPVVPLAFVQVHACELLCGIGEKPSERGLLHLRTLADAYAHQSVVFDERMERWMHDYCVFYDLDPSLVEPTGTSAGYVAVAVLQRAEQAILSKEAAEKTSGMAWAAGALAAGAEPAAGAAPTSEQLLDALCTLSRYRAERSRFVRDNRADVAAVCADVFARMVAHCSKRRKVGFVTGLFGGPMRASYTVFPGAVFWSPTPHPDATYAVDEFETYVCERGFWWRSYPCKYVDTSKDIGALMHAIDTRMRVALDYGHPLKARSLPKYQSKFVDDAIREYVGRREAEEAARIHIDRGALKGIRSASARTREALLTDEEREDAPTSGPQPQVQPVAAPSDASVPAATPAPASSGALASAPAYESARVPAVVSEDVYAPCSDATCVATLPSKTEGSSTATASPVVVPELTHAFASDSALGTGLALAPDQVAFLRALLAGEEPTSVAGGFVTLTVDAINDAFMDLVGDTVVEFVDGAPALVEDYVEDVRDCLEEG